MQPEYTLQKEDQQKMIKNLTRNLKALRLLCGCSQEKMAELVGVTRQTILAIENGKREMTWTMFLAFYMIFSVNEKTSAHLYDAGVLKRGIAGAFSVGKHKK